MGFAIYYRSTQQLSPTRSDAIRKATASLNAGRTWLSCEPVHFFPNQSDGRLFGGSKPNFSPHPDDAEAAVRESLPNGTVHDMLEILCTLSRDFKVDWELSHDHAPGPIGFIRGGVCEPQLREQVEGLGDLGDIMQELIAESEEPSGRPPAPSSRTAASHEDPPEDDDQDASPSILPFRPKR